MYIPLYDTYINNYGYNKLDMYFHPFMIAIIILHSRDGIDMIEIFPSESAAFSRLPPPATQKK